MSGPTARLDAELLLASVVGKDRTWLMTWGDKLLSSSDLDQFEALVQRRISGEPVAYILGTQAFWDVDLRVTPAVLIPRPETEALVEWAIALNPSNIADLGTGSGAIAIAIARELKHAQVAAFDLSDQALEVARQNAAVFAPRIKLHQGSWLSAYSGHPFDLIVSNPPYIDESDDQVAGNVRAFEPHVALFSDDSGLKDIRTIAQQSRAHLTAGGWLLFEHGLEQGEAVRRILTDLGYTAVETRKDLAGHDRLTGGCYEQ